MPCGVAADVVPWRLRPNEDMHLDLDARIALNGAESHSMNFAFMHPTECGPAGLAEAQAPSGRRLVPSQIIFAADPCERAGRNL